MSEKDKGTLKDALHAAEISDVELEDVSGGTCNESCQAGCSQCCESGTANREKLPADEVLAAGVTGRVSGMTLG